MITKEIKGSEGLIIGEHGSGTTEIINNFKGTVNTEEMGGFNEEIQ